MEFNSLNEREKELLLDSINNYLGHLSFVFRNRKFYETNDYVNTVIKRDIKDLKDLRIKLFSIVIDDL